MRVARPVVLDPEQTQQLGQWSRARSQQSRLVECVWQLHLGSSANLVQVRYSEVAQTK